MNHSAILPCYGSSCAREHVQGWGAWSVRVFHAEGDPDQTRRITLGGHGMEVTLLPSKGLSVLGAEIGGIPVFWDPPRDHLPDPDLIDLEGPLLMRGDEVAGGRWIEFFMAGVEMLGLDNWGVAGCDAEGRLLILHGNVSNTPVASIEVAADADRIVVDGRLVTYDMSSVMRPSPSAPPRFLVEKRVILDSGQKALYLQDRITNISGGEATVDWGYHIQLRPEAGCRFLVPSAEVAERRGGTMDKDFETWQPLEAGSARQERDFVHRRVTADPVFPDGSEGARTLLRYPDKSGIEACIPVAPFTMSWLSAGGEGGAEFRRPEDPETPLFVREWNGVGPEIGASDLDHGQNIDPGVVVSPLAQGGSLELQLSFRPVEATEAARIEQEIAERRES